MNKQDGQEVFIAFIGDYNLANSVLDFSTEQGTFKPWVSWMRRHLPQVYLEIRFLPISNLYQLSLGAFS